MDERDRDLVARYFRDKLTSDKRAGCPDTAVLEQIAAGVLPPSSPWYDHLTTCGPCFRETEDIRKRLQARSRGKRGLLGLVLASLVAGVLLYWWRS